MKHLRPVIFIAAGVIAGFLCGAMITTAYSDQMRFNYDQVVAKIGDTTATRGQLAERALNHTGLQLLDTEFVNEALVQEVARRQGITVTPAEVAERVDEYMYLLKQYKEFAELLGAKESLDAVSRTQLEDRFRATLLAEKVIGIQIDNHDINDMSLKVAVQLKRPEMVKLVLIACDSPLKAKEALNRLNKHEDPRTLSDIYSVQEVAKHHGEVGWFTDEGMSPAVADALFGAERNHTLQPGEHTKIIDYTDPTTKAPQSLIFYVDDYRPAYLPKPDEVLPIAKFLARTDKLSNAWSKWLVKQVDDKTLVWKHIKSMSNPDAPLVEMPIPLPKDKPAN